MINLNVFIIGLAVVTNVVLVMFNILYTKLRSKRGYDIWEEAIYRIALPWVTAVLFGFFTYWHWATWLLAIGIIISFFIFLILWDTEYFLGTKSGLDSLGTKDLYFHTFDESTIIYQNIKVYTTEKFRINLNNLLEIIFESKENKEYLENANKFLREQIRHSKAMKNEKIDEEELKKITIKDVIFKDFADTKINYLFYHDNTEQFRGYKFLVFISKRPYVSTKLEGVFLEGSRYIDFYGKKWTPQILIEGMPPSEDVLVEFQKNKNLFVDIFTNAKDVRLLDILKTEKELLEKRYNELEEKFRTEAISRILYSELTGEEIQVSDKSKTSLFKMFFILTIIYLVPTIVLIIILILMVI